MLVYPSIENLLYYAQSHLLLDDLDVIYCRNLILDELKMADYEQYEVDYDAIEALDRPDTVISPIVAYAIDCGIITAEQTEYFTAKIMNILSLRPSEVVDMFDNLHAKNPSKAFDWLYDYSIKNNYIKQTEISKNRHWEAKGTKGKIEITINTSRPEKSNADTAKLLEKETKKYPLCNICQENEGYAHGGMIRQTLRTIPLTLGNEDWFWQFSPYSYFNQHGIAVNAKHTPMKIDEGTINKMFDFVDFAPNYFIGCNAALPRVGGSILTHDHFQGGQKLMPMHKAGDLKKMKNSDYPYIDITVVDWYNSVIRLSCTHREKLIEFTSMINDAWKNYSDESLGIIANDGEPHNAITPILRKIAGGKYCMEIILRNNSISKEFPDGVFHAHPEFLNIKSESIGLIEAMGLFILPGRLDRQLSEIEKFLTKESKYNAEKLSDDMKIHQTMIEKLIKEAGSGKLTQVVASLNIKDELNRVCECILDNTAVFKKDERGVAGFDRFLNSINIK